MTDPIKGKTLPEKWWFKLGVKRDDNYHITDKFWVTGLVSNLDNMANKRIRDYVKKGRMVLIEGVIQEWQNEDKTPYTIVLAKLVRVELVGGNYKDKRLLNRVRKGQDDPQ